MPAVMRDIVVMLPGITGSVLQKDGRDVWAISGQALGAALSSLGGSIKALELTVPDPRPADLEAMLARDPASLDDLGDGVKAKAVIEDFHGVLGLGKIDGYSKLKRTLLEEFGLTEGGLDSPKPANFFAFPYDWRRDNRIAAMRLKHLVDTKLPVWKEHLGTENAKVILVGHSMGGLVSRHYLECLEGWRDCRALITFGTPYRGSLCATDYMANGYKKLFLDLTAMMRSFNSVYQLLPIYKSLRVNGQYIRMSESSGFPNLDVARAKAADAFHREIERAVEAHRKDQRYLDEGYSITPIVGIRQPTLQSAVLEGGKVAVSENPPEGVVSENWAGGDGTVPLVSAIPLELSDQNRQIAIADHHGCLQNNEAIITDVVQRIRLLQEPGMGGLRDLRPHRRGEISLRLEDLYLPGEPVVLEARVIGGEAKLKARVAPVGRPQAKALERTVREDGRLTLEGLEPGLYRVAVRPAAASSTGPGAVHGLFEVGGKNLGRG